MDDLQTVQAHAVTTFLDSDGIWEIVYSYTCPHCGKMHTQREADGRVPLMDAVCYSTRCGAVCIQMPWYREIHIGFETFEEMRERKLERARKLDRGEKIPAERRITFETPTPNVEE